MKCSTDSSNREDQFRPEADGEVLRLPAAAGNGGGLAVGERVASCTCCQQVSEQEV